MTPNFWAYYEVNQEERIHSLTLAMYLYGQGVVAGSWVLLAREICVDTYV